MDISCIGSYYCGCCPCAYSKLYVILFVVYLHIVYKQYSVVFGLCVFILREAFLCTKLLTIYINCVLHLNDHASDRHCSLTMSHVLSVSI